jgi:hypothetical protein
MKDWRRYEILLPLFYNSGSPVPKTLIADAVEELEARFGAVSSETQIIHGRWRSGGTRYSDELVRMWIDVEDTPEVQSFFVDFKERLKSRFEQLDIWITSHSIRVI